MAQLMSIKRNVDVCPGQVSVPAVYHVSQGDKGTRIILGLINNGENYTIPADTTAFIRGHRSDGTLFTEITADVDTTEIKFNLTEDMTEVPGRVECEAVMANGSANITSTANFVIDVEKSPASVGSVFPGTDAAETWLTGMLKSAIMPEILTGPGVDQTVIDGLNEALVSARQAQSDIEIVSQRVDSVAPEFTAVNAYSEGDYVYASDGTGMKLYRFTADHEAGSGWLGTDVEETTVMDEVLINKRVYLSAAGEYEFNVEADTHMLVCTFGRGGSQTAFTMTMVGTTASTMTLSTIKTTTGATIARGSSGAEKIKITTTVVGVCVYFLVFSGGVSAAAS